MKRELDVLDVNHPGDGRHIAADLGQTRGEASIMRVDEPSEAWPVPERASVEDSSTPTYYDMPTVKPPPWRWYIPGYFYLGGAAGSAAALGATASLAGRGTMPGLTRKARWIAAGGDALGAACLIADLGRPARFLNMMRVFRPSSPMNVGTWILAASGAFSTVSLVFDRRLPRIAAAAELGAGLLGLPLATYTGVLLANTATPLWSRSSQSLPILFGASAAASTASLLELWGAASPAESRSVSYFSIAAKASEAVAMQAVQRELGTDRLRQPLRRGKSGWLWRGASLLGGASLAATLLSRNRSTRVAGTLGTAAAIALRFAIVEAGKESARDPRATSEPQRRDLAAPRTGDAPKF